MLQYLLNYLKLHVKGEMSFIHGVKWFYVFYKNIILYPSFSKAGPF